MTKKFLIVAFAVSVMGFTACKSGNKDKTTTDSVAVGNNASAPVMVSTDDELVAKAKDATKDFPTVNTTIENGEITLNGTIKRDNLQSLLQSVNALHAKKVNNKLVIKD